MIYVELLAFFAVLALYIKWNYGSPYVVSPVSQKKTFLRKSVPLLLFIASGMSLTLSLIFNKEVWSFYLFFIISAVCLILAPIVTYLDHRETAKKRK